MNSRPFDPQSNALTRLRYIPTMPVLPATYQYSIFCGKVKTFSHFFPGNMPFLTSWGAFCMMKKENVSGGAALCRALCRTGFPHGNSLPFCSESAGIRTENGAGAVRRTAERMCQPSRRERDAQLNAGFPCTSRSRRGCRDRSSIRERSRAVPSPGRCRRCCGGCRRAAPDRKQGLRSCRARP